MSEIVELIKVLRERTGAGLMDCKHALVACNNDIEASITWLREKGIAKQAKKASRIAAEGLTTVIADGNKAVVLEINCETDFVAHADPFIQLVKDVALSALKNEPKDVEELKATKTSSGQLVSDLFNDAGIKLGEKLDLRRFVIVHKNSDELFGTYIHMGGALSVLLTVKGGTQELADNLAMCIASTNPTYLTSDQVNKDDFAKEKEIQIEKAKEDPSFAKKPLNIQDKIIEGRVTKHFEEQVFVYQEYILDSTKKVGDIVKENKVQLLNFTMYKVGEGIEKKQDNFAEEVAREMNSGK